MPGIASPFQGGGAGGLLTEVDWFGVIQWEFLYSDDQVRQHHDLARLPNGNVLLIAWELISVADAVASGRDPVFLADELWPDHIVEVESAGSSTNIVWEWHVWDHLVQDFDSTQANFGVVADHPELVNVDYPATAAIRT